MNANSICAVDGCCSPIGRAEYCNAHYLRKLRYGDPLAGNNPRGSTAGSPRQYLINHVLTYTGNECLIWPFSKNRQGYGTSAPVLGNSKLVSRQACEAENGPPPTPDHVAAHKCGNGHLACVARKHLRWATMKENKDDEIGHGTRAFGTDRYNAVLTEDDVREIRSQRGQVSQRKLAKKFNISQTHIGTVQRGGAWSWVAK